MFWYDWTMIILIPGIIVAIWAQTRVSSAFNQYSRILSQSGYTAAQAARGILDANGLSDIRIEQVGGNLTDHYDPRHKVLRLSQPVYNSTSLAALGVAAHEVGHAMQDKEEYAAMKVRSAIAPVAQFGNYASWLILIIGLIFGNFNLAMAGVVVFLAVVIFQLVTLPLEYNASSRALIALEGGGYLRGSEVDGAKKVLNAAALTYVAAALTSILTLLRLFILAGGARRD